MPRIEDELLKDKTSVDIPVDPTVAAGKFLFNDLYDREAIKNVINKYRKKLFNMNLAVQKTVCMNSAYFGRMNMFSKKDDYQHELLGIPQNCYSCFLPAHIVPYYSKKLYYDRYDGGPVSLIDIMNNDDIFGRRCIFTVGEYVFMNLYMQPEPFGTRLFIITDDKNGLKEATVKELIEKDLPWSLRFEPQSPTGYTYKRKGLIFNDGVVKEDTLKWNEIVDYRKINVWKSYMTGKRDDVNLLCQAECEYSPEGKNFIYGIPYVEHALSHIENCKLFMFNQKFFDGYSMLRNKLDDGRYYFRIPIKDRSPVPVENIRIFTYDENTMRFQEQNNVKITLHYPNVYTFLCNTDKLLRVEWDYKGEKTYMEFRNVFEDYMDYVGEDTFVEEVLTDTLPEPFKSFEPSPEINPDITEFLEGGKDEEGNPKEWDNLDDYYVDKLKDILKELPDEYPDVLEEILKPQRPSDELEIHVPDTPTIPDRETNNNLDAIDDPEKTEIWEEPFVYVKITNPTDEPYDVTVTVDGVFTDIEHTYVKDGEQYIYIPADLVDDDSDIIITIHDCPKESQEGDVTFTHINSAVPMPDGMGDVNGQSLLFYEKKTRQYIDGRYINFYLKAQQTSIPGIIAPVESTKNDPVYSDPEPNFVTKAGKGIYTKDGKQYRVLLTSRIKDNSVYLADKDKNILLTFHKEPLVLYEDYVVVPGPEVPDGFVKMIPSNDLDMGTSEPALLGMRIGVVTTNVHRIYKFEDVRFKNNIKIPEFKLDPSNQRFRLYLNGILAIEGRDWVYTPQKKYGDDALFKLVNQKYANDPDPVELIIEYLPIRSKMVYVGKDISEFTVDNTRILINLADMLELPIMKGVTQIYINGIRIPDKMMSVLENTRIVINTSDLVKLGIDLNSELIVTVYEEQHDDDLYNYTGIKGDTLNGIYMDKNEDFKDWIITRD